MFFLKNALFLTFLKWIALFFGLGKRVYSLMPEWVACCGAPTLTLALSPPQGEGIRIENL